MQSNVVYDFQESKIIKCLGCDLMYLTPFPTYDDLKEVYNEEYYLNQKFYDLKGNNIYGYTDYIAERFTKQLHYKDVVKKIQGMLPVATSRRHSLLEIGCGLGYFLDVASDFDFDVAGIEFNKYAVEYIRNKFAFDVKSGELTKNMFEKNSFDVVALFDVIEHLSEAFPTLETIHEVLAPGGVLVLTTMDSGSFMSRVLGKRLEDFRRTREHLLFFTRKTITTVLQKYGFEIIEIRYNPHTFALGMLLQRLTIYNRTIFSSVKYLFDLCKLSNVNIHVNFGTKMIVYARKPHISMDT